jgi:hypothetical protein
MLTSATGAVSLVLLLGGCAGPGGESLRPTRTTPVVVRTAEAGETPPSSTRSERRKGELRSASREAAAAAIVHPPPGSAHPPAWRPRPPPR